MRDEHVEELLKDKINWKFFNFLLDKLTKFEDSGYETEMYISLYVPKFKTHRKVMIYKNGEYEYFDTSLLRSNNLEKYGLFYSVYIKSNVENEWPITNYEETIKTVSKIVSRKLNLLVVKPMN